MGEPHRIGVVGVGTISRAYLDTFARVEGAAVTAFADLDLARAEAAAAGVPGSRAMAVPDLIASDDVDVVLNLTIPAAHAEIALAAIAAGKGVYGEKPLALSMAEGREISDAAAARGVPFGSAPDTVLGTGTQTARRLLDDGAIGRPVSANAVMITPGHERWHPAPDFYYRAGGGPLLDMGPYYVASLVQLLGPVRAVFGAGSRTRDERVIAGGDRAGERIPVDVLTHVTGILEHAGGAISTLTTSFDGTRTTAAPIEVHGEEGSLAVPDPNTFGGAVRVVRPGDDGWHEAEPSAGYVDASRGVGILDLVTATPDRAARASGDLAMHHLDVMTALLASAESGRRIELATSPALPPAVPLTPEADWRRLR